MSEVWLLEVNLRHIAGNGSYGVLLKGDDDTTARIMITPGAQLAIWSSEFTAEPILATPLPTNFLPSARHRLMLSYAGSLLRVQLDGLAGSEAVIAYPLHSFALLTQQCSAAFSAISLSDHFRDEFLNDSQTPALLGWQAEESNGDTILADWHVQNGALEQTSALQGEHTVLKGSQHEQYEVGATIRLRRAYEQGQPAFGLLIWPNRAEKLLILFRQSQSHWMLAVESAGSLPGMHTSVELPVTFDPTRWHTLRLQRQDDQLTIFLNGPEVLTISLPSRSEGVGLVTRDAAAAFTSVWQTAEGIRSLDELSRSKLQ